MNVKRKRIDSENSASIVMMKGELDLFSSRPVQSAIVGSAWTDIRPISALSGSNPITFHVPGNEDDFIDPVFYLKIRARVKTSGGNDLPADSTVALVNCFGHAMFKEIDLKIGDKIVSSSTNNYPYRAFIERILNFGGDAKNSQLQAEMFYKDSAGAIDAIDPNQNIGYSQRKKLIANSQSFSMLTRISTDISNQARLLPNALDISIVMHQSSNAFRFMYQKDADAPTLELEDVLLFVRRVQLAPPMATAIAETMRLQSCKYPISRVLVKSFQIGKGLSLINKENISMGLLPKAVVIGIVDSDAYLGVENKSPFNLKSKSASFISLFCDSVAIPAVPFEPKFKMFDAVREYISLFQVSGMLGMNTGNNISYGDYMRGGYVLYGFDLTPDECGGGCHSAPSKVGNLSLKMTFDSDGIDETSTVVIYMVYDNAIYIDNHRNVIADFS